MANDVIDRLRTRSKRAYFWTAVEENMKVRDLHSSLTKDWLCMVLWFYVFFVVISFMYMRSTSYLNILLPSLKSRTSVRPKCTVPTSLTHLV